MTRTEYARCKPLDYAAAVTEGLRRALKGDAAYSGLITKDPLHTDWSTEWLHGGLHTLGGLEEALVLYQASVRPVVVLCHGTSAGTSRWAVRVRDRRRGAARGQGQHQS
ncbi:replication initiation protein [Streptomyces candidus]|uniref:replication initiation protein n=1 Tax=Streptomyces candidus TaxID=67283 RepID=UPI001C871A27|nr:replication initiation protein [Streptomyces candidus]